MTVFDRVVPQDRFLLAGIVIVVAALLTALYRWTPFGLSTRAASENEVSAMLAGLSPSRLAIMNTVLACVVAGGLGMLVAPLISLDAQTLAFQVVPALGAALLAGFTSFFIACFAGLAIGMVQSLLIYWGTQSWFPTDEGGSPLRGLPELFVFLVIVLALFLRGATLPGRGELVEKRLPAVPRPERLLRWGAIAAVVGAVALIVFPYSFRQAGINSLLGVVICFSLVVIVGFVGQISVVQLALAGVAGFTMSHLTTDVGGIWATFPISLLIGAATATIVGLLDRSLGAAGAGRQPRGRDARGRGRARAVRLPERTLGWRYHGLARQPARDRRARSVSSRLLQRTGRQDPEPDVRLPRPRSRHPSRPARRQRAALQPGEPNARRAFERARRRGGRDQRP